MHWMILVLRLLSYFCDFVSVGCNSIRMLCI
uniref:Uncharacterized protein n=1 Tax=Arundo donax TaxID=35708 RepID=A0A0A9F1J8_ARUDO